MNQIIYDSATTLAGKIRGKQISSEELVKACIYRIEEVNPKLNAVVRIVRDRALIEAREADKAIAGGNIKGPLHGIPITIKDSLDTVEVITTGGTKGRISFLPNQDATVVARLRRAGAILIGKTNTPELTLSYETDNQIYGRTNNPYDFSRTSGGSSGGAAAIIASGGSPLDIGSDTAGSIRVPSHFCGIAGIKPTSGRVPRTGHIIPYGMGALDGLTTLGPIARYVEDLILALPIICGIDWRDPAIIPIPLGKPDMVNLKLLHAAFFIDNGIKSPEPAIAEVVRKTAKVISDAVLDVEEDCPPAIGQTWEIWRELWTADGRVWQQRLLQKAGTIEKLESPENSKVMPTVDFFAFLEKLDGFRSDMLAFFEKYDVLICPTNAYPALPHGTSKDNMPAFSYTMTYNLTGWPVAVVRAGTSPEGLPIGIQVVARPWREDVALTVAKYIESALGGWKKPPI